MRLLINKKCLIPTEILCGDPPEYNLTTKAESGRTVGSSVSYFCETGYRYVSGDVTRTCTISEEWLPTSGAIDCEGKIIRQLNKNLLLQPSLDFKIGCFKLKYPRTERFRQFFAPI